ncbi:MAG: PAS domain S-box protein [Bacteroidota bacterium]|nr:PAS domain S-box protein [Bacteroidota bacterium]
MKSIFKTKISTRFINIEKKLPLEKFIPAAFVIFLLCVFILSIITFKSIEIYETDIDAINYTNEVLKKVEDFNVEVLEIPLMRRGYIITGNSDYLIKFDSLVRNVIVDLQRLKDLTMYNPLEQKMVFMLDSLITKNIEIVDSSISEASLNKIPDTEYSKKQISATDDVQKNLSEIKKITHLLILNERSFLFDRNEKAKRTNFTIKLFIIVTSIFSFIVIGLSLFISDKLIKNKGKAENELLKSYEELENRVEERTLELKESNEKLSDEIDVRKKTEETLRESEQRFRMMADSAPVHIWISGKDKMCIYVNLARLEFTGRTLEQEMGEGWAEGIHPDDFTRCVNLYKSSFDKGEEFEMEYRLRAANGEYYWVLDKGIPRYEGNEFVGYIGSCIDINERKKNERFLKIQYDVSKTLTESKTIEEASKKILSNICSGIHWDFGILWIADEKNEFITPDFIWSEKENEINEYSELNISRKIPKGVEFPGTIFKEGKTMWTSDISTNEYFNRKEEAKKMGWHSELGIPISNGSEIIAIIECFSKKSIEEKQDLIEVLESAGRQIGNFIERKKAEENLRISYLALEEKVKERTTELAGTLSKLLKESSEKEEIQNKIKIFAHAIRSIKDCVYISDLNHNTIFVNQAFERTYGFREEELLQKEIPFLQKINSTSNLRNDIINKTLKTGWKGELITYRKDGSGFHTYLSTSSIRNDEGELEAIVGICQDITELKNTEEIIRKRNSLLNLLNDVIRFTNKTFDFFTAIQYALNKVCEYTQWKIGHYFIGKDDSIVSSKIWNNNLSKVYFKFKNFTERENFVKGEGYPGKTFENGKAAWLNLSDLLNENFKRTSVTRDANLKTAIWIPVTMQNKTIGVLEFFQTDERPLDQELLDCIINIGLELGSLCEKLNIIDRIKQNEKILNEAQHIAKLGSWEWDVVRDTIAWSDEMYDIYELNKNEFKPTFEGYLKRLHPQDVEKVKSIITKSLETKEPFNFYHKIITPSEKIKTMKSQGEIYLDENGEVIRMFGTGHDVTEIREVEEELKRINTKLIETQKELIYTEKLAALGRFSSGIAHEIRNPLANINSLAQLIAKADIDEKNKRRLKYITTNVDIANKIIKNLLSYASPEDLDFHNVNLNDILNSILESVEARCKNNNIEIVREIPNELHLLYLDKLRLESAFMNFISNSIDAMYEGGILTVKVAEDRLKNEVIINFIDTGVGIPAENMDKILEPFFTTKDEGVGLGMGLAYQTIKLHHGEFILQSTDGIGTNIQIKLPIRKINSN